jgi:hypothetical protein
MTTEPGSNGRATPNRDIAAGWLIAASHMGAMRNDGVDVWPTCRSRRPGYILEPQTPAPGTRGNLARSSLVTSISRGDNSGIRSTR